MKVVELDREHDHSRHVEHFFGETSDEILNNEYEPLQQFCGPLTSQSVTMISGHAGVGKSLWTLDMCAHMAAGVDFESWKVPEKRRVLYVDGELTPWQIQTRLRAMQPAGDHLSILHSAWLASRGIDAMNVGHWSHQEWLLSEVTLALFDVIVFDTVTALLHPEEDQSVFHPDYWLQVLHLNNTYRSAGKAVIWVDHLNKQGETFGTAAKKWTCDNEWQLENWEDQDGPAFHMKVGKQRTLIDTTAESSWRYGKNYGWKQEK